MNKFFDPIHPRFLKRETLLFQSRPLADAWVRNDAAGSHSRLHHRDMTLGRQPSIPGCRRLPASGMCCSWHCVVSASSVDAFLKLVRSSDSSAVSTLVDLELVLTTYLCHYRSHWLTDLHYLGTVSAQWLPKTTENCDILRSLDAISVAQPKLWND